jgi:hypothetical protein
MSSFQQIGEKGRTGSAWKRGGWGWGQGGRNDPNNVCTYEYMNKEKKENEWNPNLKPSVDVMILNKENYKESIKNY